MLLLCAEQDQRTPHSSMLNDLVAREERDLWKKKFVMERETTNCYLHDSFKILIFIRIFNFLSFTNARR